MSARRTFSRSPGRGSKASGSLPGGTMVSLKRVSDHKVVETDHRKGKVVEVDTFTLAPDGKSIKVEWDDKESKRKGSYTMEKSP